MRQPRRMRGKIERSATQALALRKNVPQYFADTDDLHNTSGSTGAGSAAYVAASEGRDDVRQIEILQDARDQDIKDIAVHFEPGQTQVGLEWIPAAYLLHTPFEQRGLQSDAYCKARRVLSFRVSTSSSFAS